MLAAIVGFEITITRIVGKLKGSQNRPAADRAAVAAGAGPGGGPPPGGGPRPLQSAREPAAAPWAQ
jgi:hypothetical protein